MLRSFRRFKSSGAAAGDGDAESVRSTRKEDAVPPPTITTVTMSPLQTVKKSASSPPAPTPVPVPVPVPVPEQQQQQQESTLPSNRPTTKPKTKKKNRSNLSIDSSHAAAATSSTVAVAVAVAVTVDDTSASTSKHQRGEEPSHSSRQVPITTPTTRNKKKTPVPESTLRGGWNIMVADDDGVQKLVSNDHHQKEKEKEKKGKKKTKKKQTTTTSHNNKEGASGKEQQISMSTHHHQPDHVKHHPLVSPAQTKKPTVASPKRGNNIFMGVRQGSLRNLFKRDSSKRSVSSNRSKESESEACDSSSYRSFALDESNHSKQHQQQQQQQQHAQSQNNFDNLRQGITSAGAYPNIWLKDINANKTSSLASDGTDEGDDGKNPKGGDDGNDDDDGEDYNDNPYQDELEELVSSKSKKRKSINNDKRKALVSKQKEDVGQSTASIYIEDESETFDTSGEPDNGREKKNSALNHSSINNGSNSNSNGSLVPRDEETLSELTRLRKENAKLSNKLEYAESEVEKLKKERRSEKAKIKDVTSRLDQMEKEHAKTMEELVRQEHDIMEKDMLIMTLEEKNDDDGGGGRRNKAARVSAAVIPDRVQVKEYQDTQDDCSELSGEDYGNNNELRISTIRNARPAEKEKEELAAKDREIMELKLQVKQLKEEQKEDHPNRKPVDDLVKENKALRKQIAALRDKEREYGMLNGGGTVAAVAAAAEKAKNPRGLSASSMPSDFRSEETDKNNETLSYDADEMLDEFEMQELHEQLKAQGIPPTLHMSLENSFENRMSTISMGDQSYLYDLENQLANKEHEQEQELLEEARELYQVALEEKGIPGSRELLLFIYTELLEDTQEKRQEERMRLELKLEEEKKKVALEIAREKKEGSNLERFDGELHPDRIDPEMIDVLTDIRDDIGKRKSFNYSAMMKEINKANAVGDSLKKELEYAQERLQEKEKEVNELKAAATGSYPSTNRRLSLSANMQGELQAVRAEKDTITQHLKDELLEVLEKLDEKDESIACLQNQIIQSSQKSDQDEKIQEQEKEIIKYKQLAEDRAKDVAVIRLEIEELRDEMGLRPSDKNYFSKSKSAEEDGSVAGMRLSESLSQIFKWGDKGTKEPPKPTPLPEPKKDEDDDEDENGPSKIMGSFVKNYLAKKATP